MPLAYLPSPARETWHLGPVPLRAQALCVVAGILLGLFVTAWRYRAAGGPRGVVLDVAAWAVPAGLVPAALTLLLAGAKSGVPQALRTWDEVAGFPGAVALGAAGAWLGCRCMRGTARRVVAEMTSGPRRGSTTGGPGVAPRDGTVGGPGVAPRDGTAPGSAATGSAGFALRGRASHSARDEVADTIRGRGARIRLSPIMGAVAPALLYGHAVAMVGQWIAQRGYGKPSALWWSVEISPAHRAQGLENFATFQPVFAYQALWDVALGIAISWVAHRLALSGGQVLALACAGYCAAGFGLFWLGIAHSPGVLGLAATSLGDVALFVASVIYLARTVRVRVASAQLAGKGPLERSRPVM
jgi:prolipoprotein diacylglyceryltransferase